MCGIVGVLSSRGPVDVAAVEKVRDMMAHRGPDASGTFVSRDGRVAIGHRRLSIIDLSQAANQPMRNRTETIVVAYNGEIYNFKALREALAARGRRFETESDTEVLIAAYEQWGDECVGRLRGMYAFAVWDDARRRLFLARDRIGIKPLFYYWDGATFVFASELGPLMAFPGVDRTIDHTALYDFLTYQYVPAPKTAYRHARKLEAGHVLSLEEDGPRLSRYWDVPTFGAIDEPLGRASTLLRDKLEETVRMHMVSDVPLGILLSGGIDSSSVTALAAANPDGQLRTFTASFDDAGRSESAYAEVVARSFGTRHTDNKVDASFVRTHTRGVAERFGEPFGDSSILPTMEVCRTARQHVTVALSGDGGDEVFAGYRRYAHVYRRMKLTRVPGALRRPAAMLLGAAWPSRFKGGGLVADLGARDPIEVFARTVEGFSPAEKRSIAGPLLTDIPRDYDDYWRFRQYWRPDLDLVTRLQYLDLKTYLPDDILAKVDRASMAVSLEARPPLLDHELVELAFALPVDLRFGGLQPKRLLRSAMSGILPAEILDRPKQGFSVPWKMWMKTEAGRLAGGLLGGGALRDGLLAREGTSRLLETGLAGGRLWDLVILNAWYEREALR